MKRSLAGILILLLVGAAVALVWSTRSRSCRAVPVPSDVFARKALHGEGPDRSAAAAELSRRNDETAHDTFRQILVEDADPAWRSRAAQALGRLRAEEAFPDHCKLGICPRSARSHNEQVQSSGHFIGNGLTWLPKGTVPKSVGHVARDDREDDERTTRHGCVSFPLCCRGHQPEGGSGPVTPPGVHEQPCGVIGVMDDGLGRVCVGSTFTRWGTSYYSSSSNHDTLRTLAEQIAVWLAGGRGKAAGGITYGYKNQVGRTQGPHQAGPSVPRPRTTIRILDYRYYVADFDGRAADNDDPSCIAARHGGRANVLFCDGRVEALTVEQIMSPANDYWDVHK
ncbi:MAG: H-X9-DG-CTERM domain-containing protein [Planctomycetota bacterium]